MTFLAWGALPSAVSYWFNWSTAHWGTIGSTWSSRSWALLFHDVSQPSGEAKNPSGHQIDRDISLRPRSRKGSKAQKAGLGWDLSSKLICNPPHAQLLPISTSDRLPGHHSLKLRSSQTRYKSIPPYWHWVKTHPTYQPSWGIQSRTCSHNMFNTLVGLGPSESHVFFKICLKWDKHLH